MPSQERPPLLARLDAALAATDAVEPLEDARFLETHVLYEARSDQRRQIIAWLCEHTPRLISGNTAYRVLSVGCGSGPVDVPLAASLAPHTEELVYVGVNPNRVECEEFARAFDEAALPGARLEVLAETFDEFEPIRPFELVHFVHSLYYMADAAAAIERARGMTAPGGRVILLHAPRNAMNELAGRFYDKLYGRPTLFAEDITAMLERAGARYDRTRIEARVDATDLLGADRDTALALRDFILQVDSRRLPDEVQDLVDHQLRAIAQQQDARWFLDHPVDAFVLEG